ncbi:hypothetical protein MESS2_100011 [Mesorhizobium metallidurans STM 2683]|uniref:Uncharacterized protein n=1 Tax=Mesorhizobium metallidurans STM 2683 TaxID=1297569 RepID=M5ETH6_9HYPH|nr:hypothetical protein MESS2_100011 [Mesorhizobium metallidurans STM 2683]
MSAISPTACARPSTCPACRSASPCAPRTTRLPAGPRSAERQRSGDGHRFVMPRPVVMVVAGICVSSWHGRRLHRNCRACRRQPRRNGSRPCQQLRLRRVLPGADRHSGPSRRLVMDGRVAGGGRLRADRLAGFSPAELNFPARLGGAKSVSFRINIKKTRSTLLTPHQG